MDVIYEAYLIFIKGDLKYTPPQGQISAAVAVIDSHYLSKCEIFLKGQILAVNYCTAAAEICPPPLQ